MHRPLSSMSTARSRTERRAARATEYKVGEAITFVAGKRWFAGIVTELSSDRGGTLPVVELVDWCGTAPATRKDLLKRPAAGARWGKATIRARRYISGLWLHDDPRGRWLLAARRVAAPACAHLDDPFGGSYSVHDVDDLAQIARAAVITAR